jgi:hypothetical protein
VNAHPLILPKDAEMQAGVLTETPFMDKLFIRRRKYKREQELLIAKYAKKSAKVAKMKKRRSEVFFANFAAFLRVLCD